MTTATPPLNFTTILQNTSTTILSDGKYSAGFYIKVIVLLCLIICGTVGNILIIATISTVKKLNVPGNNFIINLASSDLLITGVCLPIILVNVIRDYTAPTMMVNYDEDTFCEIVAYLKTIALHVSWYSLGLIAINRYYSVCRPVRYMYHFNQTNINKAILMVWMWVILVNLPLIVGWAIPLPHSPEVNNTMELHSYNNRPPVIYDKSSHDCVLGTAKRRGYTFASGIFIILLPIGAIIGSYSLTILAIVKNRRKLAANMQEKQLKQRYQSEKKIFFMLFTVVMAFVICWSPALVYEYIPKEEDQTGNNYTQLVVNWLALSNSAMNAFFYGVLNKSFRMGYKRIGISLLLLATKLCCWCECSCKKQVERVLKRNRVFGFINAVASTRRRSVTMSGKNVQPNKEIPTNNVYVRNKEESVFSIQGN